MTLPAWLSRTLGDVFRTVRLRTCPRCHAPVLAGLDADNCAFPVRADPTPINTLGEALALLTGRATYDLVGSGSEKKLYIREEHNIGGTRRYLVFPEHRCGQTLAAHSEENAVAAARRKKLPKTPPF